MSSKGVAASILPQLFRVGLYKSAQGRLVRQVTFICIVVLTGFGAITLANGPLGSLDLADGPFEGMERSFRVGVPVVLWLVSGWIAYRAVNVPRFADFLIAVESELEKVVWPARKEVMQATVVVLATMLFFGTFLSGADFVWKWFFRLIHFIEY